MFENHLYYTDWFRFGKGIKKVNKFTGSDKKKIKPTLWSHMDIHVYHPLRQPNGKSSCNHPQPHYLQVFFVFVCALCTTLLCLCGHFLLTLFLFHSPLPHCYRFVFSLACFFCGFRYYLVMLLLSGTFCHCIQSCLWYFFKK